MVATKVTKDMNFSMVISFTIATKLLMGKTAVIITVKIRLATINMTVSENYWPYKVFRDKRTYVSKLPG